jgi:hypothetical protein
MINAPGISIVATAMSLILATGCSDDRVVQVATRAADRQAEQNDTMARLQDDVAGGTQRLVEADASARHEIVGVHRDLLAERSRLDTGWNALEEERKQIAHDRRTESILVPAIQLLGGLVLVVALLGFSWYALVKVRTGIVTDSELSELLVYELVADESRAFVSQESPAQITHEGDRPSAKD